MVDVDGRIVERKEERRFVVRDLRVRERRRGWRGLRRRLTESILIDSGCRQGVDGIARTSVDRFRLCFTLDNVRVKVGLLRRSPVLISMDQGEIEMLLVVMMLTIGWVVVAVVTFTGLIQK